MQVLWQTFVIMICVIAACFVMGSIIHGLMWLAARLIRRILGIKDKPWPSLESYRGRRRD
jgi:hypothetical protein